MTVGAPRSRLRSAGGGARRELGRSGGQYISNCSMDHQLGLTAVVSTTWR